MMRRLFGPAVEESVVSVVTAETISSGVNVLPSVSTILTTKPSCSINDVITSVLPSTGPRISSLAVLSQPVVDSAACVTAEDADSESQGGETNPPKIENPFGKFGCCLYVFVLQGGFI